MKKHKTWEARRGAMLLFLWLASASVAVDAVTLADFSARTFTNAQGVKLPYRLFIPTAYDSAKKYPLVLFLHGSDDRGSDNRSQFNNTGCWIFLSSANQSKHPCFFVAPQCPANNNWERPLTRKQVMSMLESLQSEFTIDPDRWYVTGLSMGGSGTWALATRNSNAFAAAVPMSGDGLYYPFGLITRVGVWNFHAANDPVVKVSHSDYIIAALRAAGGTPIYTRYENGGHPIWDIAYRTPGLVDWVMEQKRGATPTLPLKLAITNPPAEASFLTSEKTLNLAGIASDITELTWKNYANNANGSTKLATHWFIEGIPLKSGSDNLITIQGRGASGSAAYRGDTTVNCALCVKAETPISIAITTTQSGVALRWTGGAPPYVVEQSSGLGWESWRGIQSNRAALATFPISGTSAFFRIQGASSIPRSATVDDFAAAVFVDSNGQSLPYRIFVPTNSEAGRRYPLVLFLHGYAESGSDNRIQLTQQTSPLIFVSPANQERHPCFMVAPQCPDGADWNDAVRRQQLRSLLSQLLTDRRIDPDRIYITGFSFGAVGVWDAITQNPTLFAAAVPISSYWSGPVDRIAQLPLWIFQSADDIVAGILDTDQLVRDLRNAGGNPIYTRYDTGGHAIWPTAYETPGLVDWVMSQKRGLPSEPPSEPPPKL